MNIGLVYRYLGDFWSAIEFNQKGLSIAKDVFNTELERKAYVSLGVCYSSLGDFKNSIQFHQQAFCIAKETGNKDEEGRVCLSIGVGYDSLNDFKTAIEFYRQALSIAKQIENKELAVKAYNNLGGAYHSLRDFKTAIEYHQRALQTAKEVGNKDTEGLAYYHLGLGYHSLGDFKTSIEFNQHALSIAKAVGNKTTEEAACHNLGLDYQSLCDFNTAIEFHQQALSIAKEIDKKEREEKAYFNLGICYHCLGHFSTAMAFHQHALSIAKEAGNKDIERKVYCELGLLCHSLGDFKKAIEFHHQDISLAKESGNKDGEGRAYCNLANCYFSLGDFTTAIEFYKKGLKVAKEARNKDTEGNIRGGLGNAFLILGDLEKAIEYHEKSLSIMKKIGGNKLFQAKASCNLGIAHRSLGDNKKAIELFQEALVIAQDIGDKDTEEKACGNLGVAYRSLRDYNKAIEYQQKSLNLIKETGNKDSEAKAYSSLGAAYYSLGDFLKAEEFMKLSVESCNEMRHLLKSKDGWKISLRDQYKDTYNFLWLVQLQQNKTIEALCTAELGRAQALMDLMESQYGVKADQTVSTAPTETVSCTIIHLPSPTIFLAATTNSINFWVLEKGRNCLQCKRKKCQFVQKALCNTLESMNEETYKQIVFEEVLERNPEEKECISSEREEAALKVLYDAVIGPVSHLIEGDELIIVPDGPLFLVPYAALVDPNSRYLSESLRIRLVPTLTSLKMMAECPDEYHCSSGALLVGDPWVECVDINGTKGKSKQLPAARQEVEMIGTILNIAPLTGRNATKAKVLSRLSSVALIHIATHGSAETGEIVLSPNSAKSDRPEEEDFLLTMADVLNAKLRAKLVVLSCCHSGQGKITSEGVVGLARAFLGAGARSVLASLWSINDQATLNFMRYFYQNLMERQSACQALHQAMKQMRKSDDFRKVRHWAPFVLIGDDVRMNVGQLR